MPTELVNILIQLPVVAIFVWYSDHMLRRFEAFLREERSARAEQISTLRQEMQAMRQDLKDAVDAGHNNRERGGRG